MRYEFFFVSVAYPDNAAEELNSFLARHKVRNISREFVAHGGNPGWSFCVQLAEESASHEKNCSKRKAKIDHRLALEPGLIPLFDAVRLRGSELAMQAQLQAWQVVNNEQIYHMVRNDVCTLEDLKAIDGLGPKRVERYGEALLAVLDEARCASTGGDT